MQRTGVFAWRLRIHAHQGQRGMGLGAGTFSPHSGSGATERVLEIKLYALRKRHSGSKQEKRKQLKILATARSGLRVSSRDKLEHDTFNGRRQRHNSFPVARRQTAELNCRQLEPGVMTDTRLAALRAVRKMVGTVSGQLFCHLAGRCGSTHTHTRPTVCLSPC
ncbi:UDP-N-acetylmuramoyl-tripeptide--D-alanyl-D- alanine ligase [Anopheles sinensis]|uniref:UDP-N-acetylmuramoyl-tripeptide--D-alanyl-D-alanine ligase n=1 Tax=Anopheles sinensis TaxID=74873 RepID=A0A084WJB6_ANOSI|nr:UDP-N-acetylmuramoyl-tripeptide--D-alanyl-D- alanine ligase [Anopheles sinensis]